MAKDFRQKVTIFGNPNYSIKFSVPAGVGVRAAPPIVRIISGGLAKPHSTAPYSRNSLENPSLIWQNCGCSYDFRLRLTS